MKLSTTVRGAITRFSYKLALGHPYLNGVEYKDLFTEGEGSAVEQCYAIFANVLEIDEAGTVLNGLEAERRATDYLREYCSETDGSAGLEDWMYEIHEANYPWDGPMP